MTNHEDREEAFRALFTAHFGRVVRFVERRIGNHEVAEEIASDTFLITYGKFASLDSPDMAWLATVARGKIRDYRKHLARSAQIEAVPLKELAGTPSDEIDVLDAIVLSELLGSLPEFDREAIMLTVWEGFSPKEVAQVLGRSPVSIRKSLRRARARLARLLLEDAAEEKGGRAHGDIL